MTDLVTLEGVGTFSTTELEASLYQESFWEFILHFWEFVPGAGRMVYNWHMKFLAEELQTLAERVFQGLPRLHDLVINISPGTSKSSIASILFPAWVWTRFPHGRFICASHTDSLVIDLADKSKQVIECEEYRRLFSQVQIRSDKSAKDDFANTAGGERKSCTVGGKTPTGRHAHILLIDDPIDPQGALSEAALLNARNFMTNVIPSRKVDKEVAVTVLIMQRLHRNDPTAVMVETSRKEGASAVRRIKLPAEVTDGVEPSELSQYYQDGLMDPARLNRKVLKEAYANLGAYGYAGQYRQQPVPLGGGTFKTTFFNQREKAAPYQAKRVLYIDRACLVAGTMVTTSDGQVPIEKVTAGDLVLTRQGYKRVLLAGLTKYVSQEEMAATVFQANGAILIGTKDHLVWTENRGWTRLDDLTEHDESFTLRDVTPPQMIPFETPDVSKIPVYDLTVEDVPEFFANGVLVHNSTQDGGCYTAMVLMARDTNNNFHIEHVVRGQWEPDERNQEILAEARRCRSRYGPRNEPRIVVEAEGGSSGRDAWKGVVRALAGFRVVEDRVTGDKDRRAEPWASQLSALNVFLVEDGSWDIEAYVQEHVMFRPEQGKRGRYKDQVDASTGAFNYLVGSMRQGGMRILESHKKQSGLRIVICSREELATLVIEDHPCLLVSFQDPSIAGEEVVCSDSPASVVEQGAPGHGITKLLGTLVLSFADLNPADFQDRWTDPIQPWNLPPENLVMNAQEHGKKLWSFLTKQRQPIPEVYVFQDEGDGRALSAAQAVCDVKGLPRKQVIYPVSQGEVSDNLTGEIEGLPANPHVFAVVKSSRALVI